MATVVCKNCKNTFESELHPSTICGATAAGASVCAYFGSGIGLALGPMGAISGAIPGLVIGALIGFLGVSAFTQCPQCAEIFRV
jgi:hypothetical protein